ncbi:Apolipoprotein N-acyltransferase [Corynebacterium occultum]|uniref:Apolipoprotein N-acyltransferase n=1 Tax=Corynebacterium occultum TaxID=2675219 RepID=A0A6B8W8Y8_9CORY|nr:apolipoprotein N-acyltransferase [Corynebacterium occultum]QGU07376.1 Apolipoprotein N-acyltransferase [Corynebacterium occultum]
MIKNLRVLGAAASGLLVFASFEPLGWWISGILGLALLYLSLSPHRGHEITLRWGTLIGFIHALTLYLLLLPWIGEFVGNMPYIALAGVLSLYALATGCGGAAIARWRYGFLAFPFFYVSVEFLRSSWPFGGFAWVRLAWGQINGPLANLAHLGGPALVSLAAALTGTSLAALVIYLSQKQRAPLAWIPGTATAVVMLMAGLLAGIPVNDPLKTTDTVEVAAIQGNVPRMGLDFNAQRRAVLANHVRETQALDDEVDLIFWPENSSDVNPFNDPQAGALIDAAVQSAQAPILVGTITRDDVGDRNTMVVFDPETGAGEYHHKIYLQPFGEYMPYREFFRNFSPWVDAAGDFKPGEGSGVVNMDGITVGIATCYEVAFDAAARDAVLNGAQILTTPTNNATFGFTDMTYQQLAMSRMRAIELDRAVVVPATSGVSAIVHPDGSISQQTRIFTADTLVEELPLRNSLTLSARYGSAVQIFLVIIGVVCVIVALWTQRKSSFQPVRSASRGSGPGKQNTARTKASAKARKGNGKSTSNKTPVRTGRNPRR